MADTLAPPRAASSRVAESSREAADRRTAEILGSGSLPSDSVDRFHVDANDIPDGWTYEYKRNTVYGKDDPAYQVSLAQTGWTPVPLSRHPSKMPLGWTGGVIEQDGCILMERPAAITDQIRGRDRKASRDQVRFKEEQLGAAPSGQFSREHAQVKPRVSKSFGAIDVPQN